MDRNVSERRERAYTELKERIRRINRIEETGNPAEYSKAVRECEAFLKGVMTMDPGGLWSEANKQAKAEVDREGKSWMYR